MPSITAEQVNKLASIVAEDFGFSLSDDQLIESIYLLLENIAGFEQSLVDADDQVDRTIQLVRRRYHEQQSRENRDA